MFKVINTVNGVTSAAKFDTRAAAQELASELNFQQDTSWKQSFAVIEILDSGWTFTDNAGKGYSAVAPTAADARIKISTATGIDFNELSLNR